jgi:hypothetical protein
MNQSLYMSTDFAISAFQFSGLSRLTAIVASSGWSLLVNGNQSGSFVTRHISSNSVRKLTWRRSASPLTFGGEIWRQTEPNDLS